MRVAALVGLTLLSAFASFAAASGEPGEPSPTSHNTSTDRCKAFMAANPDLVCLTRQLETTALCKEFMLRYPDAVCLKLSVARSNDLQLATLDHDLAVAKLKARHWGGTLGCGPTVSGFVTDTWTTKALPAVSCGLVWGYRW